MLTVKELQRLKPAKKQYKRSDEKGLFVIVRPNGAIWWRFKYRWGDREKALSFGTYPDVSLKRAREKRDEARKLLDHGIDPSADRKAKKAAASTDTDTFKSVAEDWMSKGYAVRTGKATRDPAAFVHGLEHYFLVELDRRDVQSREPYLVFHWLPIKRLAEFDVRPHIVRDAIVSGEYTRLRHLVVPFAP